MDFLEVFAGGTTTPDASEGRFFEFIPGSVTDASDPKMLCRVRARLKGQSAGESSDWLVPLLPGGIEAIPKVGDPVIVGFMEGDPNRGFYGQTITTRSTGRPTEHMPLGDTLAGLLNYAVVQINQLRTDLQTLVTAYNAQVYTNNGSPPAVFASNLPPGTINGSNAVYAKAADGSTVSSVTTDKIALSATQKVR